MDLQKPKRRCEVTVEYNTQDVNSTSYNEEPAKYMANTAKGFNDSLKKLLEKWRNR